MNENMAFERMLTTYMAEEASGRAPERLVDDVLSATSRARPDPRWLALLKEPPMRTQTRVVVGTPARRLVLLAAAAALLILALAGAIVGAQLLRPPQQLASDDWPMFRGDATHAGLTNHGPKGHPVVQWQFRTNGPVQQSWAIVGDTVYVPTDFGFVHAIGVADGIERWNKQFVSYPLSGVVVADGLVLVTDGQGLLYGLDPATGTERWHSTGTAPGGKNASVGGGALYLGTEEGYLVAFDTKDGRERWRASLGQGGSVNNTAYADGLVYVATEKAGFLAIDAQTGETRWRVDVDGDQTGTPVVSDGIAYIGAGAEATVGHLRAVDAKTGAAIWTLNEPIGSPTVANGVAFAQAPLNGFQVALDPKTGTELWRTQLGGPGTVRAAVVADSVVYVPHDGKQRIYALDGRTGGELWRYDLKEGNTCCLAVARGSIFVGTDQGNVYRIGGDGATLTPASPAPVVPTTSASGASASATSVTAAVKVVWTAEPPDHGYCDNASIGIDPAGNIWVPDVANDRFSIISPDGTFIEHWGSSGRGDGEFILHRPNGNCYSGVAFAPDGSFFVLDTGNLRVQKFDAQRKFVKAWGGSGPGSGQYIEPAAIKVGPDGNVYVLDDVRGVLERYDPDGKVVGAFELNSKASVNGSGAFGVDADGNVYVSQSEPNQVAMLDPTGRPLKTFGNAGDVGFLGAGQIAVDHQGRVFVTQGDPDRGPALGVLAFDRDGGYIGGFAPIDGADLTVQFPTGIAFDASGDLILQDAGREDGTAKGRILKIKLLPPLAN